MPVFRRFLMLLILCIGLPLEAGPTPSTQNEHWAEWQNAKKHYEAGNLEDALQELQSRSREDAHYFYNVGTIYYRLGKTGLAVAYLEKANRINPHEPDIQFNLAMARSTLANFIGTDRLDPASTWTEQLADHISLDEVRGTLGLFGLAVVLLWIRAYLKSRNLRQMLIQPAGILGLLVFGITLGIYGVQRWAANSPLAVCLEHQTIRSGPGAHYMELFRAEAGSKLRILGPAMTSNLSASDIASGNPTSGSIENPEIWRQVRYSSDGIGWIKSSSLLVL
jgi:tetratricopeptide (TPR) repeat protein